jgi:hypothetical protein
MTDVHARLTDANPLRGDDVSKDDPDLSLEAIWAAIARHDERNPTGRANRQRRRRRRKVVRTVAISLAALAGLSGTALGAGSALGIIDLGGGVSATQVTSLPVWDGTSGTFVSGTANGQYIYDFAGVGGSGVVCGEADPDVATFITSTAPLTQSDLQGLLDPSSPTGLNVTAGDTHTLGITSESGGCFPASVAGPLATSQTPPQTAAAQALGAAGRRALSGQIAALPKTQAGVFERASRLRLQYVRVTRDGKRVIVKLSHLRGHPIALALAIAESAKPKT